MYPKRTENWYNVLSIKYSIMIKNATTNQWFLNTKIFSPKLCVVFFFLFFTNVEAATYYLMTSQVANARTAGSWDTDASGNGAGTNATNFTTAGDVFVVLSSQSATITGGDLQIGSATASVTLQIDGTISVASSRFLLIGVSGANSIVIFNRTSTTSVSGAGGFNLAAGSTLKTANTNGITGTNASVTTSGTNTLPNTSNYEYTGAGTQSITGLPANVLSLTLSGTASVTLDGNQSLTGVLTLGPGTTLSLSTFTLGSPTSLVLSCGATSGSVISGTGAMTLGGNVIVNDAGTGTDEATISCPVVLGAIRTFTVADDGSTASDLTISGVMSTNAAGVTKQGAGTMVMTGTNTYRAAVTISAGILSVNAVQNASTSSPLGTGATTPAISIAAGATLQYTGSGHSTGRAITLTGTGAIIDASGSGTLTLSGAITGNTFGLILTGTGNGIKSGSAIATSTGTLTKQGSGTWTLSFANTYTGLTTVSAGSLTYGINSAISTGGITVDGSTAILNLSTFTESAGTITLDNDGTISGSGTLTSTGTFELKDGTVSAVLAGSAIPLNKTTSGTVSLSGANTFTGAVTITSGILSVNAVQNAPTNSPLGTGAGTPTIAIGASGTLRYTGSGHSTTRAISLLGSGATIDASGSGTLTISGAITGNTFGLILTGTGNGIKSGSAIATTSGELTKQGAGTWTLSVANTYTGLTTVSAGSLTYGINEAISTGGITVDGASATLNLVTFTETAGTITLDNGGTITSTTGTLTTTGTYEMKSGTVSGILAGAAPLNKTTSGVVTLSGSNTYTGGTNLSGGTLNINNENALGGVAGAFTITGGSIDNTSAGNITTSNYPLALNGDFTYIGSVPRTLSLGEGTVTMNANRQVTVSSGTLTIGGILNDNTKNLTKGGSGILSFGSQAITLNDVTITGGTFVSTAGTLALVGNFANSGTFTHNNGTVDFNKSGAQNIGAATFNHLTCSNTGTKTATGNLVVDGTLTLASSTVLDMTDAFTLLGTLNAISNSGTIQTAVPTSTSATPLASGKSWGGLVIYSATTGSQTISSATSYNNLTMSNTSIANTLGGSITVNGEFTLSGGKLVLGANTLIINANISGMTASSSLTANGSSNITIGGSGALGTSLFLDQSSPGTSNRLNNFTYNRTSSTITLGDTVEITGTVTPTSGVLATGGNLKLISNASGTARVAAGSGTYITGMVTAERFIPSSARRWRFGGTPVSGRTWNDLKDDIFITGVGTGFDATLTNYSSIYSYDETVTTGDLNTGWVACTNTSDPITVGKGYRIFIRGDRNPGRLDGTISTQNAVTLDLVGDLNINDQPLPVTFNSSGNIENDGWNLVANPYASPIDWNAFHDAGRNEAVDSFNGTDYTNIRQTIYIFDGSTNSYTSFNAISGMGTGNLLTSGGVIPAGAAFWVKAVATSPLDLTIKEVYKTASTPAAVFKTTPNQFTIKLVMDSITSDETAIRYTSQAKEGYDGYDISKMYGSDINIASIAKDGSFLSANCKPFNSVSDTIPLSLGFANSGSYKMEFNNPGAIGLEVSKTIFLVDLYAKQVKDLNTTTEYTFTVDKNNLTTYGNNRFMLVVGDNITALPEIPEEVPKTELYIYPASTVDFIAVYSKQDITGETEVSITDLQGKLISRTHTTWVNKQLPIDMSAFQSGIYLISIKRGPKTVQTFWCRKN